MKNKNKIPIIWQGWMLSHCGFAEAARGYLLTLINSGKYKIKTFPYDKDDIGLESSPEIKKIKELTKTKIKEKPIWITQTGPAQIMPNIGYSIGLVVWELPEWKLKYNKKKKMEFIDALKTQDEIWTPTKFCADGMKKYGIENIHIIPHIIDPERFNPAKTEPLKEPLSRDAFRFLSVMGWSERKGASDLIRAYLEEFSKKDNVLLYIKVNHYDIRKAQAEVANIRKKIKKPIIDQPYIVLNSMIYSWNEMPSVYKSADCFVLPSRGEGFGLNYAEAMAMELPTIATKIAPMTEYINESNGYLVDITGYKKDKRIDWISPYYIGMEFPVIDVESLKKQMRRVYENREEAKKKGKKARQDMIKSFSPKVVGKLIDDRLDEIWKTMDHYKLNKEITNFNKYV